MLDESARVTRPKRDEFGPVRRKKFLESYAKWANISLACRLVGISRTTYYHAVESDPEFAEQVRLADEEATEGLEAKAFSNAFQKDSETSLWNLLKARRPNKYRDPVQRIAQTDSEGNDRFTDDELRAKAEAILANRAKDAS